MTRPYLQHGRRHGPQGSDPIVPQPNEWCLARCNGTVPGDNSDTKFDLDLAYGSGVDSGLYTANTDPSFNSVQINESGTYRIQWTADWSGVIGSPSEGQILLANAVVGTGLATTYFGFGGTSRAGQETIRAGGDNYTSLLANSGGHQSSGGLLHWPTAEDSPPTFETSLVGMTSNQNTGGDLTLILVVFIERVDLYMLDLEVALAWNI